VRADHVIDSTLGLRDFWFHALVCCTEVSRGIDLASCVIAEFRSLHNSVKEPSPLGA
jgi:hypothetical protein